MMNPGEAALRFLWGLALGAGLGLCYDFLRPLRTKHNAPADAVFMLCAFAAWVYLSFGICLGDIRVDITAALGLGAILWIQTAGRLFRGIFRLFWQGIGGLFALVTFPVKKILQKIRSFTKKLFAYRKKWGTIKWNGHRHDQIQHGGEPHEKATQH